MNRGANHQKIFSDDEDYQYFADLIRETREKYKFILHAFCFMTNHYHFLIETEDDDIAMIMKKINESYTRYYNSKYRRDGALFRGRYKSCEVTDDGYFLQVSRYISLNPVKAGLVTDPSQYRWSSFRKYIGDGVDKITNCDKTLSFFDDNSRTRYIDYVKSGMNSDESAEKICKDIGEDDEGWKAVEIGV